MDKEKELPTRKDIRLKRYDYSSPGVYFVTICTEKRKNYFWNKTQSSKDVEWYSVGENTVRPYENYVFLDTVTNLFNLPIS